MIYIVPVEEFIILSNPGKKIKSDPELYSTFRDQFFFDRFIKTLPKKVRNSDLRLDDSKKFTWYNEVNDVYNLIDKFNLFAEKKVSLDYTINNKSLSSGQMQKISFIRALLNDVEILLLDESTSNLDKESKVLIFDILKKEEVTILNSTHNREDFSYDHHIEIEVKENFRSIRNLS